MTKLKVGVMRVVEENSTAKNVAKIAKCGYKYFWDISQKENIVKRIWLFVLRKKEVVKRQWVFMSNKCINKTQILSILNEQDRFKGLTLEIGGRK